ncbi:SART-1 family protein DOT2-like isoform X2 [Solanum dulcamara]|uniref:SART-1 family protein DOT2-like isoform X2 n=1 Tax=Solanum dulcamara TaxID=45834 RepID=UPI0024862BB5|nr:SART-1 family protein DOT2-like isoform X2 [Solanum dulcamara]
MDRDDAVLFDDDDNEELRKSYERVRKLSKEKQKGLTKTFPESIASLISDSTFDKNPISVSGESQVVFTEMGDFVWGLQFDKLKEQKPSVDVLPKQEEEPSVKEEKSEIIPYKTIREVPIGKALSEALRFLRERGTLKEGDIELAGRNTDKKKSKLVGVRGGDEEGGKEIHIDRTDEFGRNLTPKESFRLFSHQFHGKGPGKKKQEKRIRQHQEELKMKNPSLSVERMTKSQAQLGGHIQPGQISGIKRKSDSGQYSRCRKFRNILIYVSSFVPCYEKYCTR